MNRREFLKGLAGLSLAGAAAMVMPPLARPAHGLTAPSFLRSAALGRSFQGTRDGLLLESADEGVTWSKIANFGGHCSIDALAEQRGKVFAQISVQGHPFVLASDNARTWVTTTRATIG